MISDDASGAEPRESPLGAPAASAGAPATGAPGWPERAMSVAESGCQWVGRPRVRLSLTGVLLLLIGGVLVTNSVWTLPVVVAGALMVVVAWMGHRLDGRFTIEWGETGTELAFRATIKAAETSHGGSAAALTSGQEPVRAGEPNDSARAEIIEGEAHTVEIDVAELKALIAAAEVAESTSPRATAAPADIRIRRVVEGVPSSEAAR
ncbi:MAG TPA: hypothetical protein VG371_00685 [Solirubrobacteraceae bacterium]|jgi:hypothetical protein|nr:hypothetical protein [Solirubrobacteraceae bacterium]